MDWKVFLMPNKYPVLLYVWYLERIKNTYLVVLYNLSQYNCWMVLISIPMCKWMVGPFGLNIRHNYYLYLSIEHISKR